MACVCGPNGIQVPTSPLSTRSSSKVFFPLTGPLPTGQIKNIVARSYMDSSIGNYEAVFAYQVSDDLETWGDAGGGVAGTFSTIGTVWTEDSPGDGSYVTVEADVNLDELFVRLGIAIERRSGTNLTAVLAAPTFSFQNVQ